MKKLLLFGVLLFAFFCTSFGQATDLIISEYGEGSSGNSKYIEIYNGTGVSVTLDGNYQLQRLTNGGTLPEQIYDFESGAVLADGDVFVLANNSTNTPTGVDVYNSFAGWNGNDAVALAKDMSGSFVVIDIIGEEGPDPGTGWNVAGVTNATKDKTLTRKSTICSPNTNWTTSAGTNTTDSEWEVTGYVSGSPASLGNHSTSCVATGPTVDFVLSNSDIAEGNSGTSTHNVAVSMSSAPTSDATVEVISIANTATEGGDYNGVGVDVVFTAAESYPATKDVMITINGDTDVEADETFDLLLDLATGSAGLATIGTDQHTVTITNDDLPTTADIRINESNCTPTGSEFIELYSENGFTLDGLVIVHFNGNGNDSEWAYDLDGITIPPGGYYVLCENTNSNGYCDEVVGVFDSLQDGPEAIAIYLGDATDFPNNTPATTINLVDALAYDTGDADDDILTDLGLTEQIDEDENGASSTESVQRGSWFVAPETPGAMNAALPVELINFRAQKQTESINLFWQTASETHNDRFEIEHSQTGQTFRKIGEIAGAHNSHIVLDYQFNHDTPENGVNYYRLKQVDEDGVYEYSNVVSVVMGKDATILIRPNLVQEEMIVEVAEEAQRDIALEIYDLQGRLVAQEKIENGTFSTNLNLSDLVAGQYFLKTVNNGVVSMVKFVKL